jgi:hypothetical protein
LGCSVFGLTTVVGAVFAIGGFFLLSYMLIGLWLGVSSRRWPTIEGEILESRAEVDRTSDAGHVSYRPKVRYRYRIGGREYVSENYTYKGYSTARQVVEEIVGRYPTGSQVQVHCFPRRPKWSVLEPGTTPSQYLVAMIFAAGMLTLGITLLLIG